jgi:hypothetical protein
MSYQKSRTVLKGYVALLGLALLGACNSLTECQRYFSIPSDALSCQRGADEVAPAVKARLATLPDQDRAEEECRSLCAEDLGGYSGSIDGQRAAEVIDLQMACVKGCQGRLFYERQQQRAADQGCEEIRIGGAIRCI